MIIIDKSKPKPAKFVRHEHPNPFGSELPNSFKSNYEQDKYWETERTRWHEGYWIGGEQLLTPEHYFYLQEWKIYSQNEGRVIYPRWRDCDDLVFNLVSKCFKGSKDGLVAKRRRFGWSSILMSLAAHKCLTISGTTVPITSADATRVKLLMTKQFQTGYKGLNSYYKPEKSVKNLTRGIFEFGAEEVETVVRNGKKVNLEAENGLGSSILCKPTQDDPTVFEGLTCHFGILDEIMLHPKAQQVKSSMRDCFSEGLQKNGTLLMGGSSGDENENMEAMNLVAEMWYNSSVTDLQTLFLPGWMGDPMFSTNGWSDEKKGTEFIEKERERRNKSTDKTEYFSFIHSFPLTIEDVFNVTKSSLFPVEVVAKINQQKIYISSSPPPVQHGNLIEYDNQIKFVPNPKGNVHILEHPTHLTEYKNNYYGGIDPIPFSTGEQRNRNSDDRSEHALIILKRMAETPVAYYKERDVDSAKVVDTSILLQRYYGNCQALLELTQGGVVDTKYRENGWYNLLADAPAQSSTKWQKSQNKKGVRGSGIDGRESLIKLVDWVNRNVENVHFIELLNDFLIMGEQNSDLGDAFKWCIYGHTNWMMKEAKVIDTAPRVMMVKSYRREGTRNVPVYVERTLNADGGQYHNFFTPLTK